MSAVICKFVRNKTVLKNSFSLKCVSSSKFKLREDEAEEIQIPVPWGHIAGKWWGSKLSTPVLAIHGWQDNANSFDRLIPLLNTSCVLAIDLPGHGLSSHMPKGCFYDFAELIIMLHRIKKYFNWGQMPLLTHSFGGALGFIYSSLFPNEIKWHINIECARGLLTLYREDLSNRFSKDIDKLLKIEKQKEESPPAYKLSEMIKMCITGSLGSISSPEAAVVLLKRGICLAEKIPTAKSSDKNNYNGDLTEILSYEKQRLKLLPKEEQVNLIKKLLAMEESYKKVKNKLKQFQLNEEDDKYFVFSRDPSLKVMVFQTLSEEFVIEASSYIKSPILSIRAKDGFLHGCTGKLYEKTLDILKTNANYLEHHEVDGTHHVHLNSPESLAPIINKFLQKYETWK